MLIKLPLGPDGNPFGVDPATDHLREPTDDRAWCENMFFQVWDPDQGVGVYLHTGTHLLDAELWSAATVLYLPETAAVALRSFGYARGDTELRLGGFEITCEKPLSRWTIRGHDAGEQTTSARLADGAVGAGKTVPVAVDLELDAVAPVHDLVSALHLADAGRLPDMPALSSVVHAHFEQALRATGSITVADKTFTVRGEAYRDHSWGPRHLDDYGGDWTFYGVSTGGRVIQALTWFDRAGRIERSTGYLVDGGNMELLELTAVAPLNGDGKRQRFDATFARPNGELLHLEGETLHHATFTMCEPHEWLTGRHSDADDDPHFVTEAPFRARFPDGDVLHGNSEQVHRASLDPVAVAESLAAA